MPQLLQIYHEAIKPGAEAEYDAIERDTAAWCLKLGCPHPYLGAESMNGPKEGWFFNGYESAAEQQQVMEGYKNNAALLSELLKNSKRKAGITADRFDVVASYRQDLSRGTAWTLGQGQFLVVTITTSTSQVIGTVFEASGGTRFIIQPADTRREADAAAAQAGPESRVLAVRPEWSFWLRPLYDR